MNSAAQIHANLVRVQTQIAQACQRSQREPGAVRLIVVTKGHPVETLRAAIQAGATDLGENYVEEGMAKIAALGGENAPTWHMIGHVQSRKAKAAVENFSWVHSLDSLKLAARMERFAEEYGCKVKALIECNVSGEETKFGFPVFAEDRWEDLLAPFEQLASLRCVEIVGLMTMAPFLPQAEAARPFFHRLARLRDFLRSRIPSVEWRELSMGMSADFEVAIEEGATMVRIGQAILGPRPGGG
ncbi:MAG: YggS family pyridoxal phosphate-dependent enzyme [Anaerolineales bacterium]|nr:YggS family pyridoxal phosphate-dependent enzyme [Anaerolineales bacterium]